MSSRVVFGFDRSSSSRKASRTLTLKSTLTTGLVGTTGLLMSSMSLSFITSSASSFIFFEASSFNTFALTVTIPVVLGSTLTLVTGLSSLESTLLDLLFWCSAPVLLFLFVGFRQGVCLWSAEATGGSTSMSTTIALGAHPSTTLTRFAPARLPRPPFSGNFSGKVGVRESWGRGKAKADLGLGVGEIWTSTRRTCRGTRQESR